MLGRRSFYREERFFMRAVVAFKVHSRALALDLWSHANGDRMGVASNQP
jgi:hypothetical protein